jgi:hypothetical protein
MDAQDSRLTKARGPTAASAGTTISARGRAPEGVAEPLLALRKFSGPLLGQVVRDTRNHDAGLEQKMAFDNQSGLPVEQLMPQLRDHELGNDHSDYPIYAVGPKTSYVLRQRVTDVPER